MSPYTALVVGLAAVLSALALVVPSPSHDRAPSTSSTAASSGVPLCC